MTDRRPLTLRSDTNPARLQEMPTGDLLPADMLGNALSVLLTGLVTTNNAGIAATDTVLQALGKLQAQTSAKVDTVAGKVLSSNDFTNAERVKLSNIGEGASNDRSKHTGTQPLSSISNAGTAAEYNVVMQAGDSTPDRVLLTGHGIFNGVGAPEYAAKDLNLLKSTGTWGVLYPVNKPEGVGDIGVVTNSQYSTDWIKQTYCAIENNKTFSRYFVNGTTWTNWYQDLRTADVGPAAFRSVSSTSKGDGGGVFVAGVYGIGDVYPTTDFPLNLNDWPAINMRGMSSGFENSPRDGTWYMVTQHAHNNQHLVQIAYGFSDQDTSIYRRNKVAGGWGGWKKIHGDAASGINSNGSYVRDESGIQFCTVEHTFYGDPGEPAGTIRSVAWTFPAEFFEAPIITLTATVYGNAASFVGNYGGTPISNTHAPALAVRLNETGVGPFPTKLLAIGRFK